MGVRVQGESMAYLKSHRFYRFHHATPKEWVSFEVRYRETDLWIRARRDLGREGLEAVLSVRRKLEAYIGAHPEFLKALSPLDADPLAPDVVRRMLAASSAAGVGPMASVAGAVAQEVGEALKACGTDIIVENGGDCYFDPGEPIQVGIYAGPGSPFSGRLGFRLETARFPIGVCTSSATVGHSLSFGKADAVVVMARDTALADAVATATGNRVQSGRDIQKALEWSKSIPGVEAAVVIVGKHLGAIGEVELMPL